MAMPHGGVVASTVSSKAMAVALSLIPSKSICESTLTAHQHVVDIVPSDHQPLRGHVHDSVGRHFEFKICPSNDFLWLLPHLIETRSLKRLIAYIPLRQSRALYESCRTRLLHSKWRLCARCPSRQISLSLSLFHHVFRLMRQRGVVERCFRCSWCSLARYGLISVLTCQHLVLLI